jgi:N-acyl-D-aspartate/D-glutamate deacylase
VGDTISPANRKYEGKLLGEIAAENGVEPFSMAIEIAIEDGFDTTWWPMPTDNSHEDWNYRREVWQREDVLLGGSDAGAHLDRMLGSSYPTRFLADCLRGRRLIPVERAIELMTRKPAELFGLTRRGTVEPGNFADLVVFDPMTVASLPARRVTDLPGGSMRLTAESQGIVHVFVNGVQTVRDGGELGVMPGTVLRSGRDTHTVAAA